MSRLADITVGFADGLHMTSKPSNRSPGSFFGASDEAYLDELRSSIERIRHGALRT